MPRQLDEIAERVHRGEAVDPVPVREILGWFDAKRRGYIIVEQMRESFAEAKVRTVPDFESAWINEDVAFVREVPLGDLAVAANAAAGAGPIEPVASTEATLRVRMLDAANQGVKVVNPDGALAAVVTTMMAGDFSQLPVMTGERQVHGVVTWKSIATRLALGGPAARARDLMVPHREIRSEAPLFEAIPAILDDGYVLVRSDDNRVIGIITATDLSLQFRSLSEPFLLVSEIETLVRNLFISRLGVDADVPLAGEGAQIANGDGLSFGKYVRLLQDPDHWAVLDIKIDRRIFCDRLDEVRGIRNEIMHFRPDPLEPASLVALRAFAAFLRDLEGIPKPAEG